jgi:hypothetical protein
LSAHPVERSSRREALTEAWLIVGALVLLVASVGSGVTMRGAAGVVIFVVALVLSYKRLLAPRGLVAATAVTILFVPIKRYSFPASFPVNLELYRVVVAVVFVAWATALLIDGRITARKSGLERPLFLYIAVIALSLVVNPARVSSVGSDAVKAISFFASFILVFYVVVSVIRRPRDIDFIVRLLAGGGAVLGFFGVVEAATGFNPFNHLHSVIPILEYNASAAPELIRSGHVRALGSAQHPIAFGAALALLLPLAVYRAHAFAQRRWWVASVLILLGVLASRSRTGILMVLAIAVVFVVLRPRQMRRLWPAVIPLLLLIHFALPGALGSIRSSFFPAGGLIAQQAHASVGSGRIATLGPALHSEFAPHPLLGEGFGTRVTTPDTVVPVPNGPILDDQWLGVLLETGVAGAFALLWLFATALRRMGRAARRDFSSRGWLLVATAGSVAGYGIGMVTYDAFSFIQVTFLFFFVLAIGAATTLVSAAEWQRFEQEERTALLRRAAVASAKRLKRPKGQLPEPLLPT